MAPLSVEVAPDPRLLERMVLLRMAPQNNETAAPTAKSTQATGQSGKPKKKSISSDPANSPEKSADGNGSQKKTSSSNALPAKVVSFLDQEVGFLGLKVRRLNHLALCSVTLLLVLLTGQIIATFASGVALPFFASVLSHLPIQQKLLAGAALVVSAAAALMFGSYALFSPGGKMNIWEKQKYIPSQYRAQHRKMLAELTKPLKIGALPLGRRCEWRPWKLLQLGKRDLVLSAEQRKQNPHLLIIGAADKGKTRLLAGMIAHDIESADRAVIVIDSDGGLVDLLARWIASHQNKDKLAQRVTLLDPTHKGCTRGLNPFLMPTDGDLQGAASAIVSAFKAIYTEQPGSQNQWNAQTANILRNCALLLIANGKGMADLPALLNDNDFRDVLLDAVEKKKDAHCAEYETMLEAWRQYKKLARSEQWINWVEPILNRVSPLLSDSRVRRVFTNSASEINLKRIIAQKGILLVKIDQAELDPTANLLGSLIVTGVKQAALSLANDKLRKRLVTVTALYLDECDRFIEKETLQVLTSKTEKFGIGVIGALRTLQRLPEDFRHQISMDVGMVACFALAKKDGEQLGPQMFRVDGRKIKHGTIQNFINKVNTSPQFELITDEEKLNIDRVVAQDARTFYCYRVGSEAGVFHLRSHGFENVADDQVDASLLEQLYGS